MFNYGCGCGITAGFTVIGLGGQGLPAFCARSRRSHIHSATRICRSLLFANGSRFCRICQKQFRANAAPSGLIIRQASRGRMSDGMSGRIVLNTPVSLGCMVVEYCHISVSAPINFVEIGVCFPLFAYLALCRLSIKEAYFSRHP